MKHEQIRKKFLDFFKDKKHTIVPSDPLVPAGDPTVLFTSAGMNQFKDQFLGNINEFSKAATCQKCLRTGDLENVGVTSYHHTFFEMLGNFSFGDYFKKEAITWAWEFMTDTLKLSEERLWVSVYTEDDEAYEIWKNVIKIPKQKIVKLGDKENFWPSEAKKKGPNGACGPCSEIFYDYGQEHGCGKKDCSPACDCGRFVEVWNLVFTQFNRKEDGALDPLPNKNIDTGMGLERLCAIMQGVRNNFETDLFTSIIEAIKTESSDAQEDKKINADKPPHQLVQIDKEQSWCGGKHKNDIHAIADHVRAVTFAISDGIVPSNESRGYVIRNLIRKSALHGKNLGIEKPFLYKLVASVAAVMKDPYPEIKKRRENISQVVLAEEERFTSTLKEGMRILEQRLEQLKKDNIRKISDEFVFKLLDTHGFSFILTKEVAKSRGFQIDEIAVNKLMEQQRQRSRKGSQISESIFKEPLVKEKTEFVGYKNTKVKARVMKIFKGKEQAQELKSSELATVVLDKSPFYGESGGQIGDTGTLSSDKFTAKVLDAKRESDATLLSVELKKGKLKLGDTVMAEVDVERRLAIMKNHTATHLLQSALRKVLGEHVQQQGSLVEQHRLRFDFTHFKGMSQDELDRTEQLVNEMIKRADNIISEVMHIEDAKSKGALAFFGDKYGMTARMVSAGEHSKELCGGTHVKNTKDIGLFKIMSEGSVASGIRRIEACTDDAVKRWIQESKKALKEKEKALKKKEDEKRSAKERQKAITSNIDPILEKAESVGNSSLIITNIEAADMGSLKAVSDIIKNRLKSCIIFFASIENGKVNTLLSMTENFVKKGMHSGKLMSIISKSVGGSGGGRPNVASGGIKDIGKIDAALDAAKKIILKEIKK